MLIILRRDAAESDIAGIEKKLKMKGCGSRVSEGENFIAIHVTGNAHEVDERDIKLFGPVLDIIRISPPFPLVSKKEEKRRVILAGDTGIGGGALAVIAGPCAVESREQIGRVAREIAGAGARFLRGGAFKPRTSPYAFRGLGEEGLKYLREAADENGLLVVSEVMDASKIEMMRNYVDVFQVGARNMQNYPLLDALGRAGKPVLLKRGWSATADELLFSAEYIMSAGNPDVILCERGIRTFENSVRFTLDISAVPVLRHKTDLPVIVDPSHAAGYAAFVPSLALSAIAAGADGIMIEVHHKPEDALSDGIQALTPPQFRELMDRCRELAGVAGRKLI